MSTLIEELSPLADELRLLHDEFGTRAYTVKMVAVQRHSMDEVSYDTGKAEVIYEETITPTPKVSDTSGKDIDLSMIGAENVGGLKVEEISFSYTEAELSGDTYVAQPDVEWFWELSVKIPTQTNPKRMRYRPAGRPAPQINKMGWRVYLEATIPERIADGSFPEPYDVEEEE